MSSEIEAQIRAQLLPVKGEVVVQAEPELEEA